MSNEQPIAPIFFWQPNDLLIFKSLEEAETYLEPVDVRSGNIGQGFDFYGRPLVVAVVEQEKVSFLARWYAESVRIELASDTKDRARLIDALQEFLLAIEQGGGGERSFEELVETARKYAEVQLKKQ